MKSPIQDLMFADRQNRDLFKKVQSYALDYVEGALGRNVYPTEEALAGLSEFEEEMPNQSTGVDEVLDMLHTYGSPATVSQIGGRYFGFVNGGAIPASLAAKNLSIYWDQNTAMQVISPIAAKLETVVERWIIGLLDLPKHTVAGFVSGTSMANFCGLAAARYRILKNMDWDVSEQGLFGAPKIRVVTCRQAHSTILKAISMNGLGKGNIEWVDVDDQGRIIPEQIPELDDRTILILQAGNVNSGAFDDFEKICKEAVAKGAWIHIDGAFGLWARAAERMKHLTKSFEHAHSWSVDGHKTLNTPYDSGVVLCADREALVSALHMTGSYIITSDERDGMFFTPEMSRRARVVELWAALKFLGKNGIDEMVYGFHERAVQFADEVSQIKGFEVVNNVVFNQVLVQCATDEITDQTLAKIQELRECWVGGSVWHERRVIRISVCSWATTQEDISRSVKSFETALKSLS